MKKLYLVKPDLTFGIICRYVLAATFAEALVAYQKETGVQPSDIRSIELVDDAPICGGES